MMVLRSTCLEVAQILTQHAAGCFFASPIKNRSCYRSALRNNIREGYESTHSLRQRVNCFSVVWDFCRPIFGHTLRKLPAKQQPSASSHIKQSYYTTQFSINQEKFSFFHNKISSNRRLYFCHICTNELGHIFNHKSLQRQFVYILLTFVCYNNK